MLALTYLSSAVDPFSKVELAGLLAHARAKNARLGVSGMMLYAGGHVIQTLEGPRETVDALFTLIDADPRHHGAYIVCRDNTDERLFRDWHMGYVEIDVGDAAAVPGFTDYLRTGGIAEDDTRQHTALAFHRLFHDRIDR